MPTEDDNVFDTNIVGLEHFTYGELHAVGNGFSVGLLPHIHPDPEGHRGELHYWRLGFLLGVALQFGTLISLGRRLR
ncbi:hypothetical protein [Halorubrum sp. LN27]|uniref:hypothetical protein n=1 Tax=Halorubrum sp. LN27 TaxID=2801032 RepID=UPI00190D85A1|nr:hypothetical protein [Halorubrum sp. LN27]